MYFYVRSKCSIERDSGKTGRTWVKQQKVTTRGRGLERNITRFEFSHVARYNLGQNLLIHITKILIFCNRPPKKSSQIESPFHAYPIPMLFTVTPEMHTWAFRPKQLWTKIGGGGGDFVPVRNDCSMARNYETHGNVKWALSGVVECVVRHSKIRGRSRGGAPGAWSSLFVDQTEAQRAEKLFFWDRPPLPLISGSGWPLLPLRSVSATENDGKLENLAREKAKGACL